MGSSKSKAKSVVEDITDIEFNTMITVSQDYEEGISSTNRISITNIKNSKIEDIEIMDKMNVMVETLQDSNIKTEMIQTIAKKAVNAVDESIGRSPLSSGTTTTKMESEAEFVLNEAYNSSTAQSIISHINTTNEFYIDGVVDSSILREKIDSTKELMMTFINKASYDIVNSLTAILETDNSLSASERDALFELSEGVSDLASGVGSGIAGVGKGVGSLGSGIGDMFGGGGKIGIFLLLVALLVGGFIFMKYGGNSRSHVEYGIPIEMPVAPTPAPASTQG